MAIRRSSGVVKDEKVLCCFASLSYHATSVQHDAYKGKNHSDGNKNLKRDVHCYRDLHNPTKRCGNYVTARRLLINSAQT